jgi:hypothetical protein
MSPTIGGTKALNVNIAPSRSDTNDARKNKGHHARMMARARRRVVLVRAFHASCVRVLTGIDVDRNDTAKYAMVGTTRIIAK